MRGDQAALGWLCSLVVRALDSRLDSLEFDSRLLWLLLIQVTMFGWANQLSISPSQSASYPQWDGK